MQIEQDMAVCADKFPALICRPVAAQFVDDDTIVLFELAMTDEGLRLSLEKHYRLVPPDDITPDDLNMYSTLPVDDD